MYTAARPSVTLALHARLRAAQRVRVMETNQIDSTITDLSGRVEALRGYL